MGNPQSRGKVEDLNLSPTLGISHLLLPYSSLILCIVQTTSILGAIVDVDQPARVWVPSKPLPQHNWVLGLLCRVDHGGQTINHSRSDGLYDLAVTDKAPNADQTLTYSYKGSDPLSAVVRIARGLAFPSFLEPTVG
jgi:hypothetical protein